MCVDIQLLSVDEKKMNCEQAAVEVAISAHFFSFFLGGGEQLPKRFRVTFTHVRDVAIRSSKRFGTQFTSPIKFLHMDQKSVNSVSEIKSTFSPKNYKIRKIGQNQLK